MQPVSKQEAAKAWFDMRRNKRRFQAWIALVLLCGLGACMFLGAGYVAYLEMGRTQPQPQSLTVHELIDRGYGENAHVLLSDFYFAENYVFQARRGSSKFWEKVWIPLLPLDADPDTAEFRVVLESDRVSSEEALDTLYEVEQVQGIIRSFGRLDSETEQLFKDEFSGVDFDKCLVVKHYELGYEAHEVPPLLIGTCCMVPGGLLLFIGGTVGFFWGRSLRRDLFDYIARATADPDDPPPLRD